MGGSFHHHQQQQHSSSSSSTSNNNTNNNNNHRVNSPRFSGPMTRRAHSFKRNTTTNNNTSSDSNTINNSNATLNAHHEIDLALNSPRSDSTTSNDFRVLTRRLVSKSGLFRNSSEYVTAALGFRVREERRKVFGHWMFFLFCGFCLFLGVFKFCANGWFGSAIKRTQVVITSFQLYALYVALFKLLGVGSSLPYLCV